MAENDIDESKETQNEEDQGIPLTWEEGECGYFPEKTAQNIITSFKWFKKASDKKIPDCFIYTELATEGFRRYNSILYSTRCCDCRECIPIRIRVDDFICSKSQARVIRKNSDVEVKFVFDEEELCTKEKAILFREYHKHHNEGSKDYKPLTIKAATEELKEMNSGYDSCVNLEYRLNGRLIGVSVIDMFLNSDGDFVGMSSNYFYYDVSPEILKRSLGVYSVLHEINYCRKHKIQFYYLGLYLPHCRKMNYKINYKPYELLLDGIWTSSVGLEKCPEVLENYLETLSDKYLEPKYVLKLPEPGLLYGYEDICLATDKIPLQYLYSAYMQGVFPWFNECDGQPVLWQSPAERFVIPIEELHVSKSIEKFLKHNPYTYTIDKAFDNVIRLCSEQKREGQNGSWIGPMMIDAYNLFHKAGYVHSIEVWYDDRLVGGFYGVLIGSVFCGESMFTIEPNSSKSAFVLFARAFKKAGGKLIDCQCYTDNMSRYGAKNIPRQEYLQLLDKYKSIPLQQPIQELL